MNQPLICLTLTGKTLEEDLRLYRKYEKKIDVVELRVDYLLEEEQLYVRRFPSLIYKPCILTIRRDIDGGNFKSSEFSRTNLFARALAFANEDKAKNFAYVDFEEDYHIPSIQDAAQAFGVRIIRSCYNTTSPVTNIKEKCDLLRKTGIEIPKIVIKPHSLQDVLNLFEEGSRLVQYNHIFCALGPEGYPSRILSPMLNSYLTYVTPEENIENLKENCPVNPDTLLDMYNFKSLNNATQLFGVTGWPIQNPSSAKIHNEGFKKHNLNAVYIPLRSKLVSEALNFSEHIGIKGLSVSVPFKESVLYYLLEQSPEVVEIGACDTVIRKNNGWIGYNTDVYGFKRALNDFLGNVRTRKMKVALIGSGGAAKAVAYVLHSMGMKVCIFNRTVSHAKNLAEKYGFDYCELNNYCVEKLKKYSSLIIQTTPLGVSTENPETKENDPISFYNFSGTELVFDLLYSQSLSPMMRRAQLAGCKVSNGYKMLEYKAIEQFKLFTGLDY